MSTFARWLRNFAPAREPDRRTRQFRTEAWGLLDSLKGLANTWGCARPAYDEKLIEVRSRVGDFVWRWPEDRVPPLMRLLSEIMWNYELERYAWQWEVKLRRKTLNLEHLLAKELVKVPGIHPEPDGATDAPVVDLPAARSSLRTRIFCQILQACELLSTGSVLLTGYGGGLARDANLRRQLERAE